MEPQGMGNMGMSTPSSSNGGGKGKAVGIVVAVIVLAVVGWMLFKGGDATNTNGEGSQVVTDVTPSAAQPKAGEIAVEGKFACTPLKSGKTPTAAECVLGLLGSDGKFYALDTSKVESMDSSIDQESTLNVVGVFTAVDADSEEAGIFKYDGVMAVRVMDAK